MPQALQAPSMHCHTPSMQRLSQGWQVRPNPAARRQGRPISETELGQPVMAWTTWLAVNTLSDPPMIPPELPSNPGMPEPPTHPIEPPPSENPVPVREPPEVKPPVATQ